MGRICILFSKKEAKNILICTIKIAYERLSSEYYRLFVIRCILAHNKIFLC